MSYSICPRCEREMRPDGSCCECPWPGDIAPIRYGSESTWTTSYPQHCRACFAGIGATHHYGCAWEECPHRRQAITCDRCEPIANDPYYHEPVLQ